MSPPLSFYTNREIILMVDNKPDATELERELANRLADLLARSEHVERQAP